MSGRGGRGDAGRRGGRGGGEQRGGGRAAGRGFEGVRTTLTQLHLQFPA